MDRRAEFESLYHAAGRRVWGVAFARRLDADLATDVMQEAFLRLWRAWQAGDTFADPEAWVCRVARNLAADTAKGSFRRHGTRPEVPAVEAPGRSPADDLQHREGLAAVRAVLAELSLADRELLALKYAGGLDGAALADRLGIDVTAVHMRLSRARRRLEDKLRAAGLAPGG